MKQLLPLFLFATMMACTSNDQAADKSEKNTPPKETEAVEKSITNDQIEEESSSFEPIFSKKYAKIFSANIGLYQHQAIIILYFTRHDQHFDASVEGEYFYVRHQKKLDLTGEYINEDNSVFLNESYKGEPTGFMMFNIAKSMETDYWAVDDRSEDRQTLNTKLLVDFDPLAQDLKTKHERYENEHQVNHNPEFEEPETATDELKVSWVGENLMAFDYHVVSFSQNLGRVSGVAEVQSDGSAVWENEKGFQLTFRFEGDEVKVESENYEEMTYGGFGVNFGGTYEKV